MIVGSPFGVRLWRLLSARRPTVGTSIEAMAARLARKAGVTSAELGELISGAEPSRQIVELLAPALGTAPTIWSRSLASAVFHDARVHPASAEIAMLAWNARLLSSDQITHVLAAGRA